jgi:hypothetical protein
MSLAFNMYVGATDGTETHKDQIAVQSSEPR